MSQPVNVIGGGLAGCEAAWQLAQRDHSVLLYEMRPRKQTGAHVSDRLAELVCSNSLGSKLPDRATGILQSEMRHMGSLLLRCAQQAAVPAGGALAVDRIQFADTVTQHLEAQPLITVIRDEVRDLPMHEPTIVATGPLTSPALAEDIARLTGEDYLYFYGMRFLQSGLRQCSINMDVLATCCRMPIWAQEKQATAIISIVRLTKRNTMAWFTPCNRRRQWNCCEFEREDPPPVCFRRLCTGRTAGEAR